MGVFGFFTLRSSSSSPAHEGSPPKSVAAARSDIDGFPPTHFTMAVPAAPTSSFLTNISAPIASTLSNLGPLLNVSEGDDSSDDNSSNEEFYDAPFPVQLTQPSSLALPSVHTRRQSQDQSPKRHHSPQAVGPHGPASASASASALASPAPKLRLLIPDAPESVGKHRLRSPTLSDPDPALSPPVNASPTEVSVSGLPSVPCPPNSNLNSPEALIISPALPQTHSVPIPINLPTTAAVHQLPAPNLARTSHNNSNQTFTLRDTHLGRDNELTHPKSPFHPLSDAMSHSLSSSQTVIYPLASAIKERTNSGLNDSLSKASYKTNVNIKTSELPGVGSFSRKSTSSSIKSVLLKSASSDGNPSFNSSDRSSDPSVASMSMSSPSSSSHRAIFKKENELIRPKEGASIFSKLLKPGFSLLSKHKQQLSEDESDDDNEGDYYEEEETARRQEGWKADVVSYVPDYPTHPSYIRVRSHHKKKRDFNRLFLAQQLLGPVARKGSFGAGSSNTSNISSSSGSQPSGSAATSPSGSIPKLEINQNHTNYKSSGAIWALKFSNDGKYLAAAGQDRVIRIWEVINDATRDVLTTTTTNSTTSTQDDSLSDSYFLDARSMASNCSGSMHRHRPLLHRNESKRNKQRVYAPVFQSKPIREFKAHTGDILDLSWSKNNFLLSSSMDKTVRLWHVERTECLCSFLHSDYVTSIKFHPQDDRFFLSGSLDSRLRLWSIPDKSVAYWKEVPDLITALCFTPDGQTAIVGCLRGQCLFYQTNGLKYLSQMRVKSNRGKNAKGSKITGIKASYISFDRHTQSGGAYTVPSKDNIDNRDIYLLITTNDSRIRMYNAQTKTVEVKYKGHQNDHSQIHASFSDDGNYVISGSENNKTFIWNAMYDKDDTKKEHLAYENFESHESTVTAAVFAPEATRHLLVMSHDPIYGLCDPPPVNLRAGSRTEARVCYEARDEILGDAKRSAHNDGQIIVTADLDGTIKVFRQDCAHFRRKAAQEALNVHSKRRSNNSTLTPSVSRPSLFSRRQSVSSTSGISRSGSINANVNPSTRSLRSQLSHSQSSCSITNISLYSNGSFDNTKYYRRHQMDIRPSRSRSVSRRRPSNSAANNPRPQLPEISLHTDKGEEIHIIRNNNPDNDTSYSNEPRRISNIQPFSVPIDIENTFMSSGSSSSSSNPNGDGPRPRLPGNTYSDNSDSTTDAGDENNCSNGDYAQYNGPLACNINRRLTEFQITQQQQQRQQQSSGYDGDYSGNYPPLSSPGAEKNKNFGDENDQLICNKCQGTNFNGKFINGIMTLICSSCCTPIAN